MIGDPPPGEAPPEPEPKPEPEAKIGYLAFNFWMLPMSERLRDAVAAGELADFRSLHTFLWSAELQRRNLAAFTGDRGLAQRLGEAYAGAGFRPEAFADFNKALVEEPPPPLTFAELEASPLAGPVRTFKVELGERVGILTLVRGVENPAALQARLADLGGVHYFDQGAMMAAAYARYRQRTLELVLVGLVAVFAMIVGRYRKLRLAVAAFLPAVLAAALTIATLALAGVGVHLLHVVALLLVLSMGVDYGVFLVESRERPEDAAASVLSVV
ncbi:MAG: hypothetical protein KC420_22215, partial [Myxococcales bacterium]|nr:hypothetical protein [Myxococcales bacterium]